jgi:ABC-type polysaccharide/polyol phosphate transport system ATPase subunit
MKIITLDQVSKRYRLSRIGSRTLREELMRSVRGLVSFKTAPPTVEGDELFALRDLSFEVEQGETIGFIGPNGSGKSTLLKLLARVTYPSSGTIAVLGSTTSLIEIGAGFHPELSGRENVYLYGSIMGMRRSELRAKFDQIVDFSELHDFMDTPVKRFSSGMYVRLGFAVAAHLDPRVLLVDEALAVGDLTFQSRCLQRIEALRRGGTTVVFVSHDMATIERLCDRVFLLHEGQIRSEGSPEKVIGDYYSSVILRQSTATNATNRAATGSPNQNPGRAAEIVNVRFLDSVERETDQFATGERFVAQIEYRAHRAIDDPVFELLFYSLDDRLHCHYTTALSDEQIKVPMGPGMVEIVADELGLMPGIFRIDAVIGRRNALDVYDSKSRQYVLKVQRGKKVRGLFYSSHHYRLLSPAGVESGVGPSHPVL